MIMMMMMMMMVTIMIMIMKFMLLLLLVYGSSFMFLDTTQQALPTKTQETSPASRQRVPTLAAAS